MHASSFTHSLHSSTNIILCASPSRHKVLNLPTMHDAESSTRMTSWNMSYSPNERELVKQRKRKNYKNMHFHYWVELRGRVESWIIYDLQYFFFLNNMHTSHSWERAWGGGRRLENEWRAAAEERWDVSAPFSILEMELHCTKNSRELQTYLNFQDFLQYDICWRYFIHCQPVEWATIRTFQEITHISAINMKKLRLGVVVGGLW